MSLCNFPVTSKINMICFYKNPLLTCIFLVRCSAWYLKMSYQQSCRGVYYLWHTIRAYICIWGSWPRAFSNELCKSLPSCAEVGPGLLGTRQLLAPSVGCVTGVCASGVTRWQCWYLGEQWAARRMQAICSEYRVPAQRSNAGGCKPQGCFYFFGLSDVQYLLSSNSAHPIEGRAICPCDPASYRHPWNRGD